MHSPENYIRIPLFVRANQELTDDEKILFGEIEALSNNGYKACYASNAYFAKLYHVSERTISRRIQHLLEEGFITKLESNKRYLRVSHAKQKDFEGHSNIVDYPQYSVIPSSVRFNDSLSAGDRLMFGEIAVLSNNEWETCWVNNQYFT
ncbi:helix-turn-helix domain-containing protein [Aerococcus urinae]|nr:helix-turn-helix domain-containing protein [Aerococcus urinae]MDK6472802.1 helix-turn-helix domain-containing protein [Aerococcus urinae]